MIDITKTYTTRNGRPVRLISDKGAKEFPIVGIVDEGVSPRSWTAEGSYFGNGHHHHCDLIEVSPPKKRIQGWVSVYSDRYVSDIWSTKEDADRAACPRRVACVYIDVEEGEGL